MSLSKKLFSTIAKNQSTFFIKNLLMPTCCNCIHFNISYYKHNDIFGYEKEQKISNCMKFGNKCLVTGEIINDTADVCRKDEDKCGIKAKFFVKNQSTL